MPVSKKRKKKGVVARFNRDRRRHELEEQMRNQSSGVNLQDLINMVAYQEYQEAGVIDGPAIPDNVEISPDCEIIFDKDVPVVIGEGEEKRQIGTASPIPGSPGHASIQLTDDEVLRQVRGPVGNYSIDKEQEDDR